MLASAARFLLLLFLLLLPTTPGQAGYSEAEVKAAFLVNFGRFVEWPAAAAPLARQELRIGIMGNNPFGPALGPLASQTVAGVPVRFARISTLKEAARCHILYLSPSLGPKVRRILRGLEGRPVLTVSDKKGFLEEGGAIELMTIEQHIRFAINLEECGQHGMKVSSRLLELARYVIMPKEEQK
ncbi:MAG: YfiR family protein [Deltaproteobacteria bacterium]|nr:MAG: YfiR family protein [Deltaproteobacteria bacterium]